MDRKNRHRKKPRFVTESMSDYISRAHAIIDDETFSVMQKMQGLNLLERNAQRQFGFFDKHFKDLKLVLDHLRGTLHEDSESRTEVLSHDSGRACVPDP